MKNFNMEFVVVGLAYHLKGRAQAFLDDLWENRWEVMLCHHKSCSKDPHAIAARVNGETVGFISCRQNNELWPLFEALAAEQGTSVDEVYLFAHVVGIDKRDGVTEHVVFSIELDENFVMPDVPVESDVWGNWGADIAPIPDCQRVEDMTAIVWRVRQCMSGKKALNKEALKLLLGRYYDLGVHDLSRENREFMDVVIAWLNASDDEDYHQMAHNLKHMYSAISTDENRKERYDLWLAFLDSDVVDRLWSEFCQAHGQHTYPSDLVLQQFKEELEQRFSTLPGELPRLYMKDLAFFDALFYMKTPRVILKRVFALKALYHICLLQKPSEKPNPYKHVETEIGHVGAGGIAVQNVYYGSAEKQVEPEPAEEEDNELVTRLLPIFINNRAEVLHFIREVDGAKPLRVTELVNNRLKKGIILKSACHKDLWSILKEYKIYKLTLSNWNYHVNA